jgi:RNA polymerase sigma-70 factor (ECF subfamily)
MKTRQATEMLKTDKKEADLQPLSENGGAQNISDSEKCRRQNPEHGKTEFVIRLKNGDSQAFTDLFNSYKDKLMRFLLRMTDSCEDAEDIVQDIFVKIFLERESLDKINNLDAYMFKMAKNRAIDFVRKFAKEETFTSDINITVESPEDMLLEREKQLTLQEAVDLLSPQQKRIYKAHREQGKPLKDIAIKMKLSLSTVQNTMNKALKNIYNYLNKKNLQ